MQTPSISKKDILIQCGAYFVRTVRRKDTSERWVKWLSDPEAAYMLNTKAADLTNDHVLKYINRFGAVGAAVARIYAVARLRPSRPENAPASSLREKLVQLLPPKLGQF
jgi:hypothetical protein